MNYFPSISIIIGYFITLCLTFITMLNIIKKHKLFGTKTIAYLSLVTVLNSGFIFSTCYLFSVVLYISNTINLILWKISLISGSISLILFSIIYSFFKEYRKIQILPALMITVLFGLQIGALLLPASIIINVSSPPSYPFSIIDVSAINYYFDFLTSAIIIIMQICFAVYFLYISIYVGLKTDKPMESIPVFFSTIFLTIPLAFFALYIILRYSFLRELFLILIWITNFGVDIMLIFKPNTFLILPNKIYSINIYHKSGILLFSYNLRKESAYTDNSKIWGNVIIGLNHILYEFVDKTDKIDVIQTKQADIVMNYDNEYGFAIIVITSKKNVIVERLIQNFSQEFKSFYKNELNEIQDLNRLINVSEFKDTGKIIEKHFQIYF
ncbi:MAG: hypothetical protein ACFFEO_01405 [Candidatus Thorarchaeota archaeon]